MRMTQAHSSHFHQENEDQGSRGKSTERLISIQLRLCQLQAQRMQVKSISKITAYSQRGYATDDPTRYRTMQTPAPQNRPTDTPLATPTNDSAQQAKFISELIQQNKELNLKLERMEKLLAASMSLKTGQNDTTSQRSAISIMPSGPKQNGPAAENSNEGGHGSTQAQRASRI